MLKEESQLSHQDSPVLPYSCNFLLFHLPMEESSLHFSAQLNRSIHYTYISKRSSQSDRNELSEDKQASSSILEDGKNGRVRKASPYERWCKIHYSVSCPPVKTITLWRQQLQFSHIKMSNSHVKMAAQLPQNYLNPLVGKWLGAVNPSHTRQSKYFSYCFPLAWSIWHTHVPGNSSILDTVNHIQKMLNFYIQWVVSYS